MRETLRGRECVRERVVSGYNPQRQVSVRHIPKEFYIESKRFRVQIDHLSFGGSILITECARYKNFHISIELGCVGWLIAQVNAALQTKGEQFFRQFRANNVIFWIERLRNKNGWFLRLSKCVKGVVVAIILPRGREAVGWRQLEECLSTLLHGEVKPRTRVSGVIKDSSFSFKDAVEGIATSGAKRQIVPEWSEEKIAENQGKNEDGDFAWDRLVVCERQVVYQSWKGTSAALSNWLDKEVELFPFQNNRAFFVCDSNEEALWVAGVGKFVMEEGGPDLLMRTWDQSVKRNQMKVVSYGGWVAVTGLPLHWWSPKFFNRIGEACGGLIEVDKRTSKFEYLIDAKLRVRLNDCGFLPQYLKISEGNEEYHVQIRPLSPAIRTLMLRSGTTAEPSAGLGVASGLDRKQRPSRDGWIPVQTGRSTKQPRISDRTQGWGDGRGCQTEKEEKGELGASSRGGEAAGVADGSLEVMGSKELECGTRQKGDFSNKVKVPRDMIHCTAVTGQNHMRPLPAGGPHVTMDEGTLGLGLIELAGPIGKAGEAGPTRVLLGEVCDRASSTCGPNNLGIAGLDKAERQSEIIIKEKAGCPNGMHGRLKEGATFYPKFGSSSGGSSRQGRNREEYKLQVMPVDEEGDSKVGYSRGKAVEEDERDSSFCPDSVNSEEEMQSLSESADSVDAPSEDEGQKIDVLEAQPGVLADFFADTGVPMVEAVVRGGLDGNQVSKSTLDPKFKYSRRRGLGRNFEHSDARFKSERLMSKLNIAMVPLKRNLFQGKGGKTSKGSGESVSAAAGGSRKARVVRGEFTSN